MKNICLRFVVSLSVYVATTPCLHADEVLRSKLEERRAAMECPGALIGIFPDSGEAEVYELGVADVDTKAPMRRDFHMRIASVAKVFLGTAVLRLAEEGKLSLDDPIAKYVEGVPGGDAITLRQLGNNTSGLFNSIENKDFQWSIVGAPEKDWAADEILKYAFEKPVYFPPGEKFRYSNTNAVLLGQVIEKVTGKPYQDVVAELVIQPLGLEHTAFTQHGKLPEPAPSAYRNGYKDKVIGYGDTFYDVTNYSASWTGAAGNMHSTLDDLAKAAKPLATGALLNEQSKSELFRWTPTGYEGIEYGFCIGRREGGVGHIGDVPGYQAFANYYPERAVTVVILTNLSNNKDRTMPAEELAKVIAERWNAAKSDEPQ